MSNKNHIQYFPSDVLNKIFSYVDEKDMCNNVPFVCEKWRLASVQSLQMKNAYFKGESVTAKDICFVLGNSPSLESVTLVSCRDTVPILRQISRCNVYIKKLILKDCSSNGSLIPEEVLINVLTSLPELSTCELFNTKFESNVFYELFASLLNLTSIDLSLNEFVTLNNLMEIVHNSHITEFKLARRLEEPRITDEEMSHLIRMMSYRLTLLHLDMGGMGTTVYNEILSCSKLIDLKMNNALSLPTSVLREIPLRLRKIKHLSIEGPTKWLSHGHVYSSLFSNTYGEQLESLKLKKFDSLGDDECRSVIKACPNLSVLSLKGCRIVNFHVVEEAILDLNQLQHLNIAFLGGFPSVVNVQRLGELREVVIDEKSLRKTKIVCNKELNIVKIK